MSERIARPNYDARMQAWLDSLPKGGVKPRLLLHCCCAPCSTAVVERLQERLDITLYYFNPNIDTLGEHERRAEELRRLARHSGLGSQAVVTPYQPERFLEAVRGLEREKEGGARCEACFGLRLREAARHAKAGGFDLFTTTLTISPMKSAPLLNRLGEAIGAQEGVPFLCSDFKKRGGFLRSTQLSRALGLYRQDYCGCAFSRAERERRLAAAPRKADGDEA